MSNSTVNIQTKGYGDGRVIELPVDGGSHIYAGTMVAQLNATKQLVPATTASSGHVVGVAVDESDNSAGSDGAKRVKVTVDRIFAFANGEGEGNVASESTPVGTPLYADDDHTLGTDSNNGAKPLAGFFAGMQADGKVKAYIGESALIGAIRSLDSRLSVDESVDAGTVGSAVASIDTRVSTEISTRASQVTSLDTRVSSEISSRTSAVTSLDTRVSTEISTRASADASIDARISSLIASIDA